MYRFFVLSMFPILLSLIWGCSGDSQFPTDGMMSNEDINPSQVFESVEGFEKHYGKDLEYQIVLENLTTATAPGASQPFSPPVIAVHRRWVRMFNVNAYASDLLRQIAEDAQNTAMISFLEQSKNVYQVVEGENGPIFPGTSQTFIIKTKRGFHKLSLVTMLVNTNDGFTGVNRVNLPPHGSRTYYLKAYDAGTEMNTELKAHIPGPCCGSPLSRVPTRERIKEHQGILGVGELDPAVYGWERKVARLTISRIK